MSRGAAAVFALVGLAACATASSAEPVTERDIVFASPGGTDLELDFVRPAGDGPFPLVVIVHGGGWRTGTRSHHAGQQQQFAASGFATAAVQYRLAPQHIHPAQRDDITDAIRFLVKNASRYAIDPNRIGLFGVSAGGHLSLVVGFQPARGYTIRGIVNVCGPTDLRTFASTAKGEEILNTVVSRTSAGLVEDLLGTADRSSAPYEDASPVAMVRKDVPPVLTLHGDADDIVPVSQADDLHAALARAGVTERLIRVKGGVHDMAQWPEKDRSDAIRAVFAFFDQHLERK